MSKGSDPRGCHATVPAALLVPIVALLLLPLPAAGQHHQICYRNLVVPNEPVAVTAACRSELPGVTCTIQTPAGFKFLGNLVSGPTWRAPDPAAKYRIDFQFSDGTRRRCTVEMAAAHDSLGMPPQGDLVGYTTDESGLVMTGVFERMWIVPGGGNFKIGAWEFMEVPTDFVVTGGGAEGAEWPSGAMINVLQQAGSDVWETTTTELNSNDGYMHRARAIAMKIEGLSEKQLKAATPLVEARSAVASHPSVTQPAPAGWKLVGGAAWSGFPWNQYITASAPVLRVVIGCLEWAWWCEPVFAIDGWVGKSKDHIIPDPDEVVIELYLMPQELLIGGQRFLVDVAVRTATSPIAQHPSVVVAGFPGEYALTGVGAYVDWEPHGDAGNLLWKLEPRPDIAGVAAASKDHTFVSPATITGYAIGVKLVQVPFD